MQFKKIAITALKIGISAGLLGYLLWQAGKGDALRELMKPEPAKNWTLIIVAWFAALISVTINIFRWQMLVRVQGMPLATRDALRIGFVSYFIALVGGGLGVVGGDAIKVVFLAHKFPKQKTAGAATVVVDRMIGLLALLVLAAAASFFLDIKALPFSSETDRRTVEDIIVAVRVAALAGMIFSGIILIPGFTHWSLWDTLAHVPKVGVVLERLVAAVRIYRGQVDKLVIAFFAGLAVHTLFTISLFCIAEGLALKHPSFGLHFVIGPIAFVTGALPIGIFEVTLKLLYQVSRAGIDQEGLIAAFGHRLLQIGVATIGLVIYLVTRAETTELMREGAAANDAPAKPPHIR